MEFENRELIESIGRWIIEDETRPSILDPLQMEQFLFASTVLEKMIQDTDMKFSVTMHEPFNSMGRFVWREILWSLVTVRGSAE